MASKGVEELQITVRFGLEPLPGVREKMGDLTASLDIR
jgi:hypothetical protein